MNPDGKKILHVEDDKNIALLVRAVLERAGYQVFSAFDAMQAVMMARQVQPDLIVLDLMIPAGGGNSVYERIRAINTTQSIPVLVYSATPKEEIEKKIHADDTTAILQKPAPPSEIVTAVKALLAAQS